MKPISLLSTGLIIASLSACSSTKPVLYPNAHLQSVGQEVANRDIEACMQLAESAGASKGSGGAGRVAERTVIGAGAGAASGAVGGAMTGAVGRGSAVGAASGATWGLLSGIFSSTGRSMPSQTYMNFVYRCLQEKGYEVAGWQ